jgi:hypothetical protein
LLKELAEVEQAEDLHEDEENKQLISATGPINYLFPKIFKEFLD